MNVRRFKVLHEAGVSFAEIARETDCDWRTVRKYLLEDGVVGPPRAPTRVGCQPRVITPFVGVVEAWLRLDVTVAASVIHERLVAEHGFTGNYQRVKMFVAEARPRIADELDEADENPLRGLHRRFQTVPGAQAQVDWGEEGGLLAHVGAGKVYSFHLVLSYSREPFMCFTTSMDLGTFWDCHRRAFAHFGGVPGSIVYDRTKTVIRRHVAPGRAVPLHPEAAAFAAHYGFVIDPLAAYRPTGKGRVERHVKIGRDHVLAGRSFDSLAELDGAFSTWLPIRLAQVHRTHGEIIGERGKIDRAALGPLPAMPYLVSDRSLRRVGKDCLVSFDASFYSVPARMVRAGQRVEIRATPTAVAIHTQAGALLAAHSRATRKGSWIVDPAHWDGLPDGRTRATTTDHDVLPCDRDPAERDHRGEDDPLRSLLIRHHAADVTVARRPLADYAAATNTAANAAGGTS